MGLVALALPLAALATVMILAIRQIRNRRRKALGEPSTGRYGAPAAEPAAEKASPQAAPEVPAAGTPVLTAEQLASRIADAETRGADRELPALYLALARDRVVSGQSQDGAELLRKSIRLAARLGQKEMHARARLDLGDLAREQGDLTTACEHWQIARQLFHETKSTVAQGQADGRMRQHGCPTDWVLNDF